MTARGGSTSLRHWLPAVFIALVHWLPAAVVPPVWLGLDTLAPLLAVLAHPRLWSGLLLWSALHFLARGIPKPVRRGRLLEQAA